MKAMELLKQTGSGWVEDKATTLSAALAYYAMFSLAPLLLIAIGVAGLVFGAQAAREQVMTSAKSVIGEGGAQTIATAIENSQKPGTNILSIVVGGAALLLGASGVFLQLQQSMNMIWDVRPKKGGLAQTIIKRVLSLAMVLGFGLLVLAMLAATTVLTVISKSMPDILPGSVYLWLGLNWLVSLGVLTLLIAAVFKVLPDVKIAWRDVWLGALITAVLFEIGKIGIGLYLGRSSVGSTYGAAGSVVLLLAWLYYSGLIFFFGAEFTQVHARARGREVKPSEHAEREPGIAA